MHSYLAVIVPWGDRFHVCLEYYEENGEWLSPLMGQLGEWVYKQRILNGKRDEK